jgi:protein phosphatase 1L
MPSDTLTEETFKKTDLEYLQDPTTQSHDAGSTASTAIIVGDRLLVANVGDSRAVISLKGAGGVSN